MNQLFNLIIVEHLKNLKFQFTDAIYVLVIAKFEEAKTPDI